MRVSKNKKEKEFESYDEGYEHGYSDALRDVRKHIRDVESGKDDEDED